MRHWSHHGRHAIDIHHRLLLLMKLSPAVGRRLLLLLLRLLWL